MIGTRKAPIGVMEKKDRREAESKGASGLIK